MTVEQAIQQLKEMPQEAMVANWCDDCERFDYIWTVEHRKEKNTVILDRG